MHNLVAMQISKCQYNLSCNKLDLVLIESLLFVQIVVDVTTWHILQEEIDPQLVLKDVLHLVDKRMVSLEQNLLFDLDIFNLIFLQNHILVETLHRVDFTVL